MMKKPMVAFQKPITDQGSVTANSTTRMKSTTAEAAGRQRVATSSQISPAIEASTTSGEEDAPPRSSGSAGAATA